MENSFEDGNIWLDHRRPILDVSNCLLQVGYFGFDTEDDARLTIHDDFGYIYSKAISQKDLLQSECPDETE